MAINLTAEQRREIILVAAFRIATENGIWAVSHGSVAKRCTVPTSSSTVKNYFPDKTALWIATWEHSDRDEFIAGQMRQLGVSIDDI